MILLFDVGNTHTHVGMGDGTRVLRQTNICTEELASERARAVIRQFAGRRPIEMAAVCSVVPKATPVVGALVEGVWGLKCWELTAGRVAGVGIDYPKPKTIGADRLANAVAARHFFGAPVVVVDFGTAVTFDVVDRSGNYVGGIIAPGLAAMTDYLHEKTALLPRIRIQETRRVVGKSTREAMLVGAVHGYRGLIRQLIHELKGELRARRLPVVATGGYAELMASKLGEITAVNPLLTLEGLRLSVLRDATAVGSG